MGMSLWMLLVLSTSFSFFSFVLWRSSCTAVQNKPRIKPGQLNSTHQIPDNIHLTIQLMTLDIVIAKLSPIGRKGRRRRATAVHASPLLGGGPRQGSFYSLSNSLKSQGRGGGGGDDGLHPTSHSTRTGSLLEVVLRCEAADFYEGPLTHPREGGVRILSAGLIRH